MRTNDSKSLYAYVKIGSENECWPWTGGLTTAGYGKARRAGRSTRLAHRLIYASVHGEVSDSVMILHKCNNKPCCNPAHLFPGSNAINQIHASLTGQRQPRSVTGIIGVSYNSKRRHYQVTVDGGKSFLYRGKDFFEACCARKSWEAQL